MLDFESFDLRVIQMGKECVRTGKTVRQLAEDSIYSKSTVYTDLTKKLPKIHPILAKQVREVLNKNKAERHIRGGRTTKQRYTKSR